MTLSATQSEDSGVVRAIRPLLGKALTVAYVDSSDLLEDRRNYNRVQRALLAPATTTVLLFVARSTRIDVDLPPNVIVMRGRLPGRLGFFASEFLFLMRARRLRVDAVATAPSAEGLPAWLCRAVGGYLWVCDIWDTPHKHLVTYYASASTPRDRLRRAAARLKVAAFQHILRRADLVVVSACLDGLEAYRIPASKTVSYSNAIDLDALASDTAASRDPNSICFISTLFLPDRGLDVLADAVAILGERHGLDVRVHVAGMVRPDVAAVVDQSAVADRFEFLGSVSIARAHELMRRSEIGVLPFHANDDLAHTQPIKLLEYMALGSVVVASDLPGVRQIVRHESESLLVAPGDADALAEAINRLLKDESLRETLRSNALVRVAQFDARVKTRSIYDAIAQTCQSRP